MMTIDQREINAVAEAISEHQACGSCAGTSAGTRHCEACEAEAIVAISTFKKLKTVWAVTHRCFATDHITYTSHLFLTETAEDALAKYNALAKQRKDYPYCW